MSLNNNKRKREASEPQSTNIHQMMLSKAVGELKSYIAKPPPAKKPAVAPLKPAAAAAASTQSNTATSNQPASAARAALSNKKAATTAAAPTIKPASSLPRPLPLHKPAATVATALPAAPPKAIPFTYPQITSTMSMQQAASLAINNKPKIHPSSKYTLLPNAGAYQTIIKKKKKPCSNTPPPQKIETKEGASFLDEIINESNDLLQAAQECQSLGRLRASAGYLLLAHARLVGLGRRFDRSRCLEDERGTTEDVRMQTKNTEKAVDKGDDSNATILQPPGAAGSMQQPVILPPMPVTHNALPDVTLMEHLARSGMELHHRRTGRGMQHDAQMERMAGKVAVKTKAPEAEEETPTKKKGGRGKKPPTLVMHTLLGAELDAKTLMSISPDS